MKIEKKKKYCIQDIVVMAACMGLGVYAKQWETGRVYEKRTEITGDGRLEEIITGDY